MNETVRPDLHDEDLMCRFVLGDLSDEERERIENAFIDDRAYFDALCAVENELILLHLRNELPAKWQERFRSAILESPARRRRVDEMRALMEASIAADDVARGRSGFRARAGYLGLGLAAAVLVTFGIVRQLSRGAIDGAPIVGERSPAPRGPSVISFTLVPGLRRAELGQANIFRITRDADMVELRLTIPRARIEHARARVRTVGGDELSLDGQTELETLPQGTDVKWRVPAQAIPAGDYILSISDEAAGSDPVASRFFSIIR